MNSVGKPTFKTEHGVCFCSLLRVDFKNFSYNVSEPRCWNNVLRKLENLVLEVFP